MTSRLTSAQHDCWWRDRDARPNQRGNAHRSRARAPNSSGYFLNAGMTPPFRGTDASSKPVLIHVPPVHPRPRRHPASGGRGGQRLTGPRCHRAARGGGRRHPEPARPIHAHRRRPARLVDLKRTGPADAPADGHRRSRPTSRSATRRAQGHLGVADRASKAQGTPAISGSTSARH